LARIFWQYWSIFSGKGLPVLESVILRIRETGYLASELELSASGPTFDKILAEAHVPGVGADDLDLLFGTAGFRIDDSLAADVFKIEHRPRADFYRVM
jgi:hypothetical protein